MWTSSIFVLCAVWRIQHVMGCIILSYVEQSSESCEWEFRCAAPPDSQAESTTAVTAPKNTHRYTDSLVRKGFVNIWSCAFAVMSLLWKRAGRLRVDSRVCCMTPSRSQRPVWRYDAAASCGLLLFSMNYMWWHSSKKETPPPYCPRCWVSGRGCVETRIFPATSPKLGSCPAAAPAWICCLTTKGVIVNGTSVVAERA